MTHPEAGQRIRRTTPALRQPANVPPRLRSLFERGLDAGVLLIQAPAGYGKTVIALQALVDAGIDPVWYACSAGDADAGHLLAGIAKALGAEESVPGQTALAALASRDQPGSHAAALRPFLDVLSEAHSDARVLVIDDADVVTTSSAAPDALDDLLSALDGRARVVVISRADLPLRANPRRLLDGRALRITGDDLLLREEEIGDWARAAYGIELSPGEAAALHGIAGGWAIALRLALHLRELRRDPARAGEALFTPQARSDLFAYLAEEVLRRIDPRMERFLRRTAVLDVLEPAVCAHLCDDERPAELIQSLATAGLPIMKAGWATYRCHSLLREFLLDALSDGELREAHAAAAAAFTRERDWPQALAHYAAAGDTSPALALLDRHGGELYATGRGRLVLQLVKSADSSILHPHLRARYWAARAAARMFDWEWSAATLREVHDAARAAGDECASDALRTLAHMLNVWGRFGPGAEAAQQLIDELPARDRASRAAAALAHLLPGMTGSGRFRDAVEMVRAQLPQLSLEPRATADDETLGRAVAAVTLARAGDFAEARAQLNLAETLRTACRDDVVRSYVPWARALVSFLGCDPGGAAHAAREGEKVALELGDLQRVLECRSMVAITHLLRGDPDAAGRGFAEVQELGGGGSSFWVTILSLLARPRLLLLRHDLPGAVAAGEANLALATGAGEAWFVCFSRLELAYLRLLSGDRQAASTHARAASDAAEALDCDLLRYGAQAMLAASDADGEPGAIGRALAIAEARDYGFLLPYVMRLPELDATLWRALAGPHHARAAMLLQLEDGAAASVLAAVAQDLSSQAAVRAVAMLAAWGARGRAGLLALARSPHPEAAAAARAALAALEASNPHGLSPREAEIVELLREGLRTKEIAERLVLSPATVSTHLQRIMAKTRTSSRAELLALAAREAAPRVK